MPELNLYETMFKRKSIRKYSTAPIDEAVLNDIKTFTQNARRLYDDIAIDISILNQQDVNFFAIKAPYFIALLSENKEGYLTNAGYILEQAGLYMASIGIGSCYLGMAQPVKAIKKELKKECAMVMAFGMPNEPLYRQSVSEFKRNPMNEITNIKNCDKLLEPVRLSPSAINSQPWYFTGSQDSIHVNYSKLNPLKAMLYEKMNKVDMGIALSHLTISAQHIGKNIKFKYDSHAQQDAPKGYFYMISACF